jgi:ATP-dependent RNA helicase DeaD
MGTDKFMDKVFSELGLSPELLAAVTAQGFEQPSPIQASAIPPALEGRDVVGQSQTGSGKTMAFAVPVVQLVDASKRYMQALILAPTRELANQVCEEVHKLASHKPGIKAVAVYGGSSYDRQIRGIEGGAQIIVGTPGRVLDMVNRRILKLENVKFLVFDEADAMLDMGFREEIDEVLAKVPADRQTLFFSATLSGPIRYLIDKYTRNAAIITVEHRALTVPTVEQMYYEVQSLDIEQPRLAIVFANTKRMVDETTDTLMARGYATDRLHGDLNQNMRERVLKNFRSGAVEVLIATDVAARGLDVNDIDLVVNLELPYDEEDYVHRIGRTGRAGRAGKAVSLLSGREIFLFQRIMRFTKGKAERKSVPSQEELIGKRADIFFVKLKDKVESGAFHNHETTLQRLLDAGHSITDVASGLMDLWMAARTGRTKNFPKKNGGMTEPKRLTVPRNSTKARALIAVARNVPLTSPLLMATTASSVCS